MSDTQGTTRPRTALGLCFLCALVLLGMLERTVPTEELGVVIALAVVALWWFVRTRRPLALLACTSVAGLVFSPPIVEYTIRPVDPGSPAPFIAPRFEAELGWLAPQLEPIADIHLVTGPGDKPQLDFYVVERRRCEHIGQWRMPSFKGPATFRKHLVLGLASQPARPGYYVAECVWTGWLDDASLPRTFVPFPLRHRAVNARFEFRRANAIVFAAGDTPPRLRDAMTLEDFARENSGTHLVSVISYAPRTVRLPR